MLKTPSKSLPALTGNLLVVDDAPSILIILKSFLEGDRCRLFPAENGAKAIEILEEQEIDLVLLDIMMPEMGGYEVCRAIRSNPRTKDIPVIFLTGLGRKEEIVRGLEVGGSDYLIKPFDREELMLRVRNHLGAHANQRRLKRIANEQRLFNMALNEELKRQAERWAGVEAQLADLGNSGQLDLGARVGGLQRFFDNVRCWNDLLSGNEITMRSMMNLQEEAAWLDWAEYFDARGVSCRFAEGDAKEIFADVRMVNLMFGQLLPWIINLANESSAITVQLLPAEESVVVELLWESSAGKLDSTPDVYDLEAASVDVDPSAELALRLARLIMVRHFGEIALVRESETSARLSLVFRTFRALFI